MIYANNAGTSWPKPPDVREAVLAALAAGPEESGRLLDAALAGISGFLGIRNPEHLILTPGCTSALSLVLDDLPWEEDDVILTSSLEHHAMIRPIEKLVRWRGVTHRAVPYRPGEPVDLSSLRDELGAGKVRLVAMTAASNVTGEIVPIAEIVALAHGHGALCLVDAAQTVGVIPVNVEKLGADILVCAGHKGPLGPQGIGCLWMRPDLGFETPSASCDISSEGEHCNPRPGYCDVGSVNLAGAAGLAAGMRWHEERGIEELGRSSRELGSRLLAALADRPHVRILGSTGAERTATLSMHVDGLPIESAEEHFRKHGVIVRAGQHCAPMALRSVEAPAGTIRISFGPFNKEEDIELILTAVDDRAR